MTDPDAELEGDKGFIDLYWSEADARAAYAAGRSEAKRVYGRRYADAWSVERIEIKAGGVTVPRWAVVQNLERARRP